MTGSSAWQSLYQAGHRLRWRWWSRRAESLPAPVISIGNLHWGGTGKTPLVEATAGTLRDAGERVAVLSRGYARRDRKPRIVSLGDGPTVSPEIGGDEPVLLAERLPGVAVAVAPRRIDAARELESALTEPPTVYLLDDGFSHLALRRDVDLLVLPVADPLGGGRLPPGGRLREPLEATSRAHGACLSGEGATEATAEALERTLRDHGFTGPVFSCPTRVHPPRLDDGSTLPAGSPVVVVTGIARPARVVSTARAAGLTVVEHLALPDHHAYPERSLERARDLYRRAGAVAVLTTSKDRVKLRGRLGLPLAVPEISVDADPRLWTWLEERLTVARIRL